MLTQVKVIYLNTFSLHTKNIRKTSHHLTRYILIFYITHFSLKTRYSQQPRFILPSIKLLIRRLTELATVPYPHFMLPSMKLLIIPLMFTYLFN